MAIIVPAFQEIYAETKPFSNIACLSHSSRVHFRFMSEFATCLRQRKLGVRKLQHTQKHIQMNLKRRMVLSLQATQGKKQVFTI